MEVNRKKADWTIIAAAVLALIRAPLMLYVSSYFVVSELNGPPRHDILVRDFKHRWQADFYSPLVKIESMARGNIEPAWATEP